jgi:hypothetical protein
MRKLNNLQKFRNFQDKSNLIEQKKCSFKLIAIFYRLCIDKECFVVIETRI